MIDILGIDAVILAIFTDVLLLLVSAQGLSHVKSIFRNAFARWVVAIVVDDAAIHTIAGRFWGRLV